MPWQIFPQVTTEVLEANHQRKHRLMIRKTCVPQSDESANVQQLDKLWSLVPVETRAQYMAEKKDTVPVLDLLPLGYSKVLGKGRIPEIPLVVRARWVSRLAEKKITEAGGVVELVA
jgi:ribosomal protein L15